MKTTDWFVAAVIATALSGCMVMLPMPPPPLPLFAAWADPGPAPGMREACAGQPEGARMPLPGRHSEVLTGVCERGLDGRLLLLPEQSR
ncbi:MAG: hypothetical protein ABJA77_00740 [Variovorax sp.]